MSFDFLATPIDYLKGVGPTRADILKKELALFTYADLLTYYPFRYIDRSKIHLIKDISSDNSYIQLKGRIIFFQKFGTHRISRLTAKFVDESGSIELIWFQGIKYVLEKIQPNAVYILLGKPSVFNGKYSIAHPELELAADRENILVSRLQPFYNSSEKLKNKGLDSKGIAKILFTLVQSASQSIPENLPLEIRTSLHLLSREEALIHIHFPSSLEMLKKAEARLKFEEFFFIQLRLLRQKLIRMHKSKGHPFVQVGDFFNTFYTDYLPFELTNAQKRVVKEIRQDLAKSTQMNRLLQGDVGSGKTLVALLSILIALDNGYQACIMAPTEILARQHRQSIEKMLGDMPIKIGLLTGSTKAAERKSLLADLATGSIPILIGTHAVIEDKVQFANLGLVVIDEQHKFGVAQRAKLWGKNSIPPHMLVMTATPIPRTLAMTLYGDLEISIIDELPKGRKPIKTYHYYDSKRLVVFQFMREQIAKGRQIYVVYPLIEESEKLDLKDLMDGFESISRAFPLPEYGVSMVHGKMKQPEKEYEMARFVKGETQILVSTTVIEVGVDVPNASVMVIENAERFGLSQLHQLRGRVGRGAEQSFCLLMSDFKLTEDGKKRIQTMVETTDGFKIAEADLRLRGPGDMQGTQQSGLLDLKIGDIVKDEKILHFARQTAIDILQKDPNFTLPENQGMASYYATYVRKTDWAVIS